MKTGDWCHYGYVDCSGLSESTIQISRLSALFNGRLVSCGIWSDFGVSIITTLWKIMNLMQNHELSVS